MGSSDHEGAHQAPIPRASSSEKAPENGKPRGSNIQFNLKQAQVANNSQKFLGKMLLFFKTLTLKKRPCDFFALLQVIREQRDLKILSGCGPDSGVLPWHSLSHNSQEGGEGGRGDKGAGKHLQGQLVHTWRYPFLDMSLPSSAGGGSPFRPSPGFQRGSLMIWLLSCWQVKQFLSQYGRNSETSGAPSMCLDLTYTPLHCSGNNMRLKRQKARPQSRSLHRRAW